MPRAPVSDVIVLLPGITGSVLQKDGKEIWGPSPGAGVRAITSLGGSLKDLELHGDDPKCDDLGDGITAARLMPDIHLIPGLWKIDGYGKVSAILRRELELTPGVNFFEFPYDWRRDNRVHARRLARESEGWLKAWRERSGNGDARLVLIGHSMGGLIARCFLELHEGWRDTRLLITFGTPYRGSLNALDFLANGLRKRLGPVTLVNLTRLVQSFTSVYQLLPIYPCVDPGSGALGRITDVAGIPGVVHERAVNALDFHGAIRKAVEEHRDDATYREQGYRIRPIAGIFQPTLQSGLLQDGRLELLRSYDGVDQGGDGTVPSVSATPIELSNQDAEAYVRERHASLQNADFSLDQVIGILRRQVIDQTQAMAPGTGISLDIGDACLTERPVTIRALPESQWVKLTAVIQDAETGKNVANPDLRPRSDGWHDVEVPSLPEGVYRVSVHGDDADSHPVTDIFAVFPEGADTEL
jgi:pimeloyl-ACP methyl ester carboxylesterase